VIRSYPSIYNLGHRAVADIFNEPVLVQEKVDGSQISFGLFPRRENEAGHSLQLRVRSKGAELVIEAPDKMFRAGVEAIKAVQHLLVPGWTYRGEYLAKPKHNTLAYDRVPQNHIALFDIDKGDQDYTDPEELAEVAEYLGFDAVPFWGEPAGAWTADRLRLLLQTDSFLGGQKIEGVVVKNYARFDPHTKHVLMAKFVSEAFKEVHGGEWKKNNPTMTDVVDQVIAEYRTPARWAKAVQHMREAGRLEDSPRDIGLLFKEVPADIRREGGAEIMLRLFELAWPKIQRGVTAGLAEWYKERLLERQFEHAAGAEAEAQAAEEARGRYEYEGGR
jgi:hypothetical protein